MVNGSLPNFGFVMENLLPVFVLTLIFLSLGFAGLAIRMFFLKKGEFRGTCSTHNPLLKERGVDCATATWIVALRPNPDKKAIGVNFWSRKGDRVRPWSGWAMNRSKLLGSPASFPTF